MTRYLVDVVVTLRPVINDPQGISVRHGLHQLGFTEVASARVGRLVSLELDAASEADARARVAAMSDRLLANPVLEDWRIDAVHVATEAG